MARRFQSPKTSSDLNQRSNRMAEIAAPLTGLKRKRFTAGLGDSRKTLTTDTSRHFLFLTVNNVVPGV